MINHIFQTLFSLIYFIFTAYCSAEEMTLEQKVGQLLMVHFNGEEANEEARAFIQEIQVGGIIYYQWANGLLSPEQVAKLSSSLQQLNRENSLPLLIAADQEGGLVARLNEGFTAFPGNKALGVTENPGLAEQAAFAMGQELLSVGVNFNLSPVVDINSNPRNPVIGIRSFGESVDIVLSFAKRALLGYKRSGIITCLKHFPGHGDTGVDSHCELPLLKKSKAELDLNELRPFFLLSNQADTIMTGHLLAPALDPLHCTTLSKKILSILREEIGFEGVIISDSLVMEGVLSQCPSIDEAAIEALNAGCDILLLGGKELLGGSKSKEMNVEDVRRIHQSIILAVHCGRLSQNRIEEAFKRVADLKKRITLNEKEQIDFSNFKQEEEHRLISKKIASLALKVHENKKAFYPPLHSSGVAIIAPKIVETAIKESSLLSLGKENHSLFFEHSAPSREDVRMAHTLAERADVIIFCTCNAWNHPDQTDLIHSLDKWKKPSIIVVLRDPLDAELFPNASLILITHSPAKPSIQAASEYLSNRQFPIE